jgi:hypothetical protein
LTLPSSLRVTFFTDYAATTKREEQITLSDLAALIKNTSALAKNRLPWLKMALFGGAVSPQGSLRHDRNLISLTGIEADYDTEVVSFEEAVDIAEKAGLLCLIYTSPSNTPDAPRWRVLCPTSSELPPTERSRLLARLNGLYRGIFAGESWVLSQSYFFGSVDHNPAHRVALVSGRAIDELDELDQIAMGKPGTKATLGNGVDHAASGLVDEAALLEQIKTGTSFHTPAIRLLGLWAFRGVSMMEARQLLMAAFEAVPPPDRDQRWRTRVAGISRMLQHVWRKEAERRDVREAEFGAFERRQPALLGDDAGWHEPDKQFVCQKLSLGDWLSRDIAGRDCLLGELLSTTSRILLVGPTGLGKTNILIAIAYAVASGEPFLHWRAGEGPHRVLFIDGEMPQRLMRARLEEASGRLGTKPENLFILSREDFPDMPPLNTEAGQKFMDHVIDILGRVDLVIFDNIQALLSGDMKEEQPWQQILPWVRDLTRRQIGQIWAHHTGHDETHSYGTKTREWQLDTVILLEQQVRPGTDIAFTMKFPKARERTPENRADFEPTVITLADDKWASEKGNISSGAKKSSTELALDVLNDEIARGNGTIPPPGERIPPNTHCITHGAWRKAYEMRSLAESPEAAKRAFYRDAKKLIEVKKAVAKHDLWVWPVRKRHPGNTC